MELDLQELRLGNLDEGQLEERFGDLVASVVDIFERRNEYQEGEGNRVTARISIVVDFHIDILSGAKVVTATCELKHPKRKAVSQAIYSRDGVLVTQHEPAQKAFFDCDGILRIGD